MPSLLICLGWPQTMIPLTSASQVTGITGVSQHTRSWVIYFEWVGSMVYELYFKKAVTYNYILCQIVRRSMKNKKPAKHRWEASARLWVQIPVPPKKKKRVVREDVSTEITLRHLSGDKKEVGHEKCRYSHAVDCDIGVNDRSQCNPVPEIIMKPNISVGQRSSYCNIVVCSSRGHSDAAINKPTALLLMWQYNVRITHVRHTCWVTA
jgi:hypothetical protein